MKRIIIAFVVFAAGIQMMSAQEKRDTVVTKSDTVIINSTVTKSQDRSRVHLDFDIPFYHKINRGTSTRSEIGAFGIGSIFSDSKAPLDFSPQNSLEFYAYTLNSHTKGHSTFSLGPGVTFRNFGLTGGNAMGLEDDGKVSIGPFPSGKVLKVSKLRVFSVNLPLLYSLNICDGFGFTLGPVVNFNAASSIVNKFSVDGEKDKDKIKNVHCNLLTVDAMFQINLKYFSIYAKYSPMNVMDKKYWPEFTTWTFGIAPF